MSCRKHSWPIAAAAACVLAAAPQAEAHQVNLFAAAEGRAIAGEAYFRGGVPVAGAIVKVFDPAGAALGETKTDAQGKFTIPCRYRCDHRLVLEVDGGHGAEYTVTAGELAEDLPPRDGAAAASSPAPAVASIPVEASSPAGGSSELNAVERQIAELRRELARYQGEIRLRDVIGGVGYIVGAMGLWFFLRGGRTAQQRPDRAR
jgi:nickel transport protein